MEKINIAELLKDCPSGMELNCAIYEDVHFEYVDESQIIHCYIQREFCKTSIIFNKYGTSNSDTKSKCVIFPKGKTTWDKFQRPFKEGDIVISNHGDIHISRDTSSSYCCLRRNRLDKTITTAVKFDRFATEEEKKKLFDAIKSNGYKWNAETKTLEKLKKDKFNITTLKPFESRVLVRDLYSQDWKPAIYGYKKFSLYTIVGGNYSYCQCIPYEGNEHLLGTTDDCDDYYKTWK